MTGSSEVWIYLSPHLDDAVLSCGGTIHAQVGSGACVWVITLFAASPSVGGLTPFTEELRQRWGGRDDPVAARRKEDRAALALLGAQALHLEYADCVCRLGGEPVVALYPTEESIFGDVHPAEADLHRQLATVLSPHLEHLCPSQMVAPLSAGHHVDHLIARRVAGLLARAGRPVTYYEDYPYCTDEPALRRALGPVDGCWQAWHSYLQPEDLRAKQDAVACYASQLSTFWTSQEQMRRALRRQATATAEGVPGGRHRSGLAERFWQPACRPHAGEER